MRQTNYPKLSEDALRILTKRYLIKNPSGQVIEAPEEMFSRVARHVASAETEFCPARQTQSEEEFFEAMSRLEFLPNSPTLMNAGTELGQLAACFVLPVEDSIESIFSSVKEAALIHKSGGGCGFDFSSLRPKNDLVGSTNGVASGPVSFIQVFDAATHVIKQGGRRRAANMGVLRVDHPDIFEFISAKAEDERLSNFNLSVVLTEQFMAALKHRVAFSLINSNTGTVRVRRLLNDSTANRQNGTPFDLGKFIFQETTPCLPL